MGVQDSVDVFVMNRVPSAELIAGLGQNKGVEVRLEVVAGDFRIFIFGADRRKILE